MLGSKDITTITRKFDIFDHDWSFYSDFLGEPYFINDLLVYFDSHTIYVCAFPLTDVWSEITPADIEAAINSTETFSRAKAVDVWGRITSFPDQLRLGNRALQRHSRTEYEGSFFDTSVDLATFDITVNRKARLARNAARNKGLMTKIVQRTCLTADHLRIFECWLDSHKVTPLYTAMAVSVRSFIKREHVYLVETSVDDRLVGFSIVSLVGRRAIFTQGHAESETVGNIGDSMMEAIICFCTEKKIERLHLGYSSPALLQFKRKWGGVIDGPPFREGFYVLSREFGAMIDKGMFLWPQRCFQKQLDLAGDTLILEKPCEVKSDYQS